MLRTILIGMKGCGKTTVGRLLAARGEVPFLDSDAVLEWLHTQERGEALPFRQIFQRYGPDYFRDLETRALQAIAKAQEGGEFVLACGGQTPLNENNQRILRDLGTIIFLNVTSDVLLKRILALGVPASFPYPDDPARSLHELLAERLPIYRQIAQITLDLGDEPAVAVEQRILKELNAGGTDQW